MAVVDAELQGAATGNAAELCWELFVVLKLQPVNEAILRFTSTMHFLEQGFTVEILQHLGTELLT